MKWTNTEDRWEWRFAFFPVYYTNNDTYPERHYVWLEWYQINKYNPPHFFNYRMRTREKAEADLLNKNI